MLYREPAIMLSMMSEDDAAKAIKAAAEYFLTGEVTSLEGKAGLVFGIIRESIDSNTEKYRKTVERNTRNGRGGGGKERG